MIFPHFSRLIYLNKRLLFHLLYSYWEWIEVLLLKILRLLACPKTTGKQSASSTQGSSSLGAPGNHLLTRAAPQARTARARQRPGGWFLTRQGTSMLTGQRRMEQAQDRHQEWGAHACAAAWSRLPWPLQITPVLPPLNWGCSFTQKPLRWRELPWHRLHYPDSASAAHHVSLS